MSNRNTRPVPAERRRPRPFSDRAAIVATAILLIVTTARLKPAELSQRIAEYFRDEIARIEQDILANLREVCDDA
jgi:hypothetical protein